MPGHVDGPGKQQAEAETCRPEHGPLSPHNRLSLRFRAGADGFPCVPVRPQAGGGHSPAAVRQQRGLDCDRQSEEPCCAGERSTGRGRALSVRSAAPSRGSVICAHGGGPGELCGEQVVGACKAGRQVPHCCGFGSGHRRQGWVRRGQQAWGRAEWRSGSVLGP